jgi:hypothetical protein
MENGYRGNRLGIMHAQGRWKARRTAGVAFGALLFVLMSGCGDVGGRDPGRVADAFETAVSDEDAAAACAMLAAATLEELEQSSGKPCVKSVLDEVDPGGTTVEISRYGTMAQVRLSSDVLFLTEGPNGWRVMAAACTPTRPGTPYDCGISGG